MKHQQHTEGMGHKIRPDWSLMDNFDIDVNSVEDPWTRNSNILILIIQFKEKKKFICKW